MKLVLFLNMGGATSLRECELFLKNMFNDKYILTIKNDYLRAFVAFFITKFRRKAMWQNYQKIGGKSPLNDITTRLCEKLNKAFESENLLNLNGKNSKNSNVNYYDLTPSNLAMMGGIENLFENLATQKNSKNLNTNSNQISNENSAKNSAPSINSSTNLQVNSNKNSKNQALHFDFINTYVPPFADDVLAKYTLTKNDEILLFPLYPHHSQTTVLSALECVKKAALRAKIQAKISEIPIFYTNEIYNQMLINHILQANESFKKGHKKILLFSAHSLPVSTIKSGDIYQRHIEAHFEHLKGRLKPYFDEILLAYQSRIGPVKWLKPATATILADLKNETLIYPLSFCIDCSESVYELDIEYRKIAPKDYFVVPCPNDSDDFVGFIKAYLRDKV